jgi:hypothetical protein
MSYTGSGIDADKKSASYGDDRTTWMLKRSSATDTGVCPNAVLQALSPYVVVICVVLTLPAPALL